MRPTRFGWQSAAFYLAMLAAYLAAPYANLTFLLLAFLTLTGALGAWWTARNLRGVAGEIAAPAPIAAGRAGEIEARLTAAGKRYHVRIALELEGGAELAGSALVLAGPTAVALAVPPLARGIHRVRRATLGTSYPLGLFSARRAIPGPAELVVYPAPGIDAAARTGGDLLAEVLGGGAGAGLEPAGLRAFGAGDAPRDVHWRASARAGRLVVRDWERAGGSGLELQIDRRAPPAELEEALGIASAVVQLARERKEPLALSSQGLAETFGEGHRPWSEALRFLAGAEPLPADGPAPPPVSPAVPRLPARRAPARPRAEVPRG